MLSFILSFLLGQLFFNSSAAIIITLINVLLINKCNELKSEKIENKNDKNNNLNKENKKEEITVNN